MITPIMDGDRVLMSVTAQKKLLGRVGSALWRMSKKNIHDLSLVVYAFDTRDPAFDGLRSAIADAVQLAYARRMGGSLTGDNPDTLTET